MAEMMAMAEMAMAEMVVEMEAEAAVTEAAAGGTEAASDVKWRILRAGLTGGGGVRVLQK